MEMTIGLVVAVAVVSVAVWSFSQRRRSALDARTSTLDASDPWFARASEVSRAGGRLVDEIEPIIQLDPNKPSLGSVTNPTICRLDDFTHDLAELAASAPTKMDNRVCRSVAVQSHSLSEALSALQASSDKPSLSDLSDRRDRLETALRDLEQHVRLL